MSKIILALLLVVVGCYTPRHSQAPKYRLGGHILLVSFRLQQAEGYVSIQPSRSRLNETTRYYDLKKGSNEVTYTTPRMQGSLIIEQHVGSMVIYLGTIQYHLHDRNNF